MSDFNEQLARMKGLMNYGKVNESSKQPKNYTLEYHAQAADGKTYGIVRECNRYYIKQAESGKELMAESYNYLGGFNNKKDYEYYSYANALKQFELKMASINEAHDAKVNISTLDPFRTNAVLAEGTNKMKDEIARQRQIMYNAAMLMNESNTIGATPFSSQPESEHANSGDEDAPFTKAVKPDMTFDGQKSSCPKCEGEPFDKGEKCACDSEKGKDVQVDGSVAGMKPAGGKVVRVDECGEDMFNAGLPSEAGTGDPQDEMFMDGAKVVNEEDELDADVEDVEYLDSEDDADMLDSDIDEIPSDEDAEIEEPEFDDEVDAEAGEDLDIEDAELGDELDENDPEAIRAEIERLEALLADMEDSDSEEDIDFDDESDDEEGDFDEEESDEDVDFEEEPEEEVLPSDDEMEDDSDAIQTLAESLVNEMSGDDYIQMAEDYGVDDDTILGYIVLSGGDGLSTDELASLVGTYYDRPNSKELLHYVPERDRQEMEGFVEEYGEDEEEDVEPAGFKEDDLSLDEAKQRYMNSIIESVTASILKEDELHVFGKHPGYRKKPMQLPATGEDKNKHGEDWNDESVHNEQPFGQSKGDSAPFDEIVNKIAAKVMEGLKKK